MISGISLSSKRFAASGTIECDNVNKLMVLEKLECQNLGQIYSSLNNNFLKNAQNLYPKEIGQNVTIEKEPKLGECL
jgi:hypothetical protein